MSHTARMAALAAAVACAAVWMTVWVTLPPAALLAQVPAGSPVYSAPRTPWGDPDLQGVWPSTDMVGVPMERPVEFGTRATLSDSEFLQRQSQATRQAEADDEEVVLPRAAGGGDGTGPPIVDPPDGRMPKMTPYGAQRMAMRARYSSTGEGPFNSAADLDYYDRCVSRGVVGSMLPVVYNNGTEIVQAPGYVAIRHEMIHDTRVIPLDNRPVPGAAIRQFMGEARGRWDGDTLVVETTNFNGTINAMRKILSGARAAEK